MNIVFNECSDALDYAIKTKTFGVFYSNKYSPNTNIHTHECCEILILKKGGNSFLVDGRVYDATDGSLFFMNQFEPHKITFHSGEEVERLAIHIHPDFMMSFSTANTNLAKCFYSKKSNKIQLNDVDMTVITDYFNKLNTEYAYADDITKECVVIQLLIYINNLVQNFSLGSALTSDTYPEALKLAIEYININFQNNITLSDVAKSSYISVNQLCRLFKDYLGTTASKYINSKKISEAKKHLKQGKSVTQTVELCGFNDYSSFIRAFSKSVGVSPGKYNKTYKYD